jgi:hypothetical protein
MVSYFVSLFFFVNLCSLRLAVLLIAKFLFYSRNLTPLSACLSTVYSLHTVTQGMYFDYTYSSLMHVSELYSLYFPSYLCCCRASKGIFLSMPCRYAPAYMVFLCFQGMAVLCGINVSVAPSFSCPCRASTK